jgi:hypothetical protein
MVQPAVRRVTDPSGTYWEVECAGRTWRHSQLWQVDVYYQMALAMIAQPVPGPSS